MKDNGVLGLIALILDVASTSVNFCQTARLNNPEDGDLQLFFVCHNVQTGSGSTQPSFQWAPDGSFGVKWPRHEASRPSSSNTEV
jgi:hypothetical protein